MKKVLLVALLVFAVAIFRVNAQDMIMKKDGIEIRAKIIDKDLVNIKYKKYGDQEGPGAAL
jgi:hypothetical protein